MKAYDDREQAFEIKFKQDEELQFRIHARRAKLIGLWAAGQLGLQGDEAQAYAKQIVAVDFEEPGDKDIVRRIHADFDAKGVKITDQEIEARMADFLDEARREMTA